MIRYLLLLLLAGATAAPASAAKFKVDVAESIEAGGAVRVDIAYGRLHIVGSTPGEVRVRGQVDGTLSGISLRRDAGALEVRVRRPLWSRVQDLWRRAEPYALDLEIAVPSDTRLFVVSRDAEIEIEGVVGPVGVGVVTSAVQVRGNPQRLEVETVSGSLEFIGRTSRLSATTMSGDLSVKGAVRDTRLEGVTGSLRLGGGPIESATLTTVSGEVTLAATWATDGSVEVETQSGGVLVRCCAGGGAALDLMTRDSEIVNQVTQERPTRDHQGRRVLQASIGDGEARIRVRTRSGIIRLVEQLAQR